MNSTIKNDNSKVDTNNAAISKAVDAIDKAIANTEDEDTKAALNAAKATLNDNKLSSLSEISGISADDLSVAAIGEDKKVSVSTETKKLDDTASTLKSAADTLEKEQERAFFCRRHTFRNSRAYRRSGDLCFCRNKP